MAIASLVPLEEYLSTSYDLDREYVDGRLVERNAGEYDHGYLQYVIARAFDRAGLRPFIELRVQVAISDGAFSFDLAEFFADMPQIEEQS